MSLLQCGLFFRVSIVTFKSTKVSTSNSFILWFAFLKQLSATHVPKQAKPFTEKEISLYLQSAPNDGSHLVMKLIVLFGIYGGMRLEELTYLLWRILMNLKKEWSKLQFQSRKLIELKDRLLLSLFPRITTFSGINACDLLTKYKAQINFSDCGGRVWRT